ncbi:MAG: hypothetical protein MUC90_04750 [Thermoplasmata archaeon]|jgi:hypothetical protein|nr:hypothetical protein [Thermoplasmata archaeon]
MAGEDKGTHAVAITSASVLIVAVMLLFMVILSPALSPVASIGDWDEDSYVNADDEFPRDPLEWVDSDDDGVGDNGDRFPYDENQTIDSDNDGVGDELDFFDQGNGGIVISLTAFTFKGYEDNYYRHRYIPNPWFQILIDLDASGTYDVTYASPIYNGSVTLNDFFNVTIDIPETTTSIRFTVLAYDVWEVSANLVTDYEIMDYWPIDGAKSAVHTVDLPHEEQWSSSGVGDGDTPDCDLAYEMDTVAM